MIQREQTITRKQFIQKNKIGTKFITMLLSILLILCTLTGCGEEEQSAGLPGFTTDSSSEAGGNSGSGAASGISTSGSGIGADTTVDEQQAIKDAFYADNGQGSTPVWAGVQVYNGDVVNIWRKMNGSEDLQKAQDIYLYDSDGNGKVITRGVPSTCVGSWFYTYEGYCLNIMGSKLLCFTADGTEKFNISAEGGVSSIVQLSDSTTVLLIKGADSSHTLAILDLEKGEYEKVPNLDLGKDRRLFISPGENGVVLLNQTGFFDVNLETGEMTQRIALKEYDYVPDYSLKSFYMRGGVSVELLYQENTELIMPIDIEKYRTVVTVLSWYSYSDLELLLDEFNANNGEYYAVVETLQDEDGLYGTKDEVFEALSKGAGPDVIHSTSLSTIDLQRAIQLGYLENLSPYMAESRIYEEDYFPCTFSRFKYNGGIYGGCFTLGTWGWVFKEEVLGSRDIRNLEDLVDALLANTEPAVFNMSGNNALLELLSTSDSVAGTVDWESKTCDFSSDLFSKLLEVCYLYSNDSDTMLPEICSFVTTNGFYGYLNEEQRQLEGDVYMGFFFDDGMYPSGAIDNPSVHMNSHSDNKEGAWQVIAWLLSEESQDQDDFTWNGLNRSIPSNVYAFEKVVLTEMEETALGTRYMESMKRTTEHRKHVVVKSKNGQILGHEEFRHLSDEEYRTLFNLKEADVEEIRELLYTAHDEPARIVPILDIIYEEAAFYFGDERSLGDTCDAIQVRVQEYLDELE